MLKIVHTPSAVDDFFRSLTSEFHWDHAEYFKDEVLAMALAEGRHTISDLVRLIDAKHHRTRYNNFLHTARWNPQELLQSAAFRLLQEVTKPEDRTIFLAIDDTTCAKRGKKMEAVGWLYDGSRHRNVRGHQIVFATLRAAGLTMPVGFRHYVKKQHAGKLRRPFRKLTELAADLIRSFEAPDGWNVVVLFDAFYLCRCVTRACRDRNFHWVSCLKSNRVLWRGGRKLQAGRYGKRCLSGRGKVSRRTVRHRKSAYETADAGWLDLNHIGRVHVAYSRRVGETRRLALATDSEELDVSGIVRSYGERWWIEQFFKDAKQRLGLGQYQNGSLESAVNHTALVCFAYALLTHLACRSHRRAHGAQGERKSTAACGASLSIGSIQNDLRRQCFLATVSDLAKRCPSGNSFVKELKRLLAA